MTLISLDGYHLKIQLRSLLSPCEENSSFIASAIVAGDASSHPAGGSSVGISDAGKAAYGS